MGKTGKLTQDYNEDDEFIIGFDGSWSNDSTAVIGVRLPRHENDKPHMFTIAVWEKQPQKMTLAGVFQP
jgi:hypothetical protein